MTYKYIKIMPTSSNAGQSFLDAFHAQVDAKFEFAPDVFTIQEETSFGSGVFKDVVVRINNGLSSYTGEKLGDDFRLIIFKDEDHSVKLGSKFYFSDNYWIVSNTEQQSNIATSVMVRRCNNVLRWVNENGLYYEEPCAIEYSFKRPSDSNTSINPMTPEGFINIFSQLNTSTVNIKSGQRFLFGNSSYWACYKIFGGGIKNFLNASTIDNDSAGMLYFSAGTNYVNEDTDDLVNGIADFYKNIYLFSPDPSSISGTIGETYQIVPNLTLNGVSVIKDTSYVSGDTDIATVSASGIATLISEGITNITISMTDNSSASSLVGIAVSGSTTPSYDIRISPIDRYIYENTTSIFTVYAYENGIEKTDAFIFAISGSNVPTDNYTFTTIGDNSFSIKNNEMYLDSALSILVSSGSHIEEVDFELRGAW